MAADEIRYQHMCERRKNRSTKEVKKKTTALIMLKMQRKRDVGGRTESHKVSQQKNDAHLGGGKNWWVNEGRRTKNEKSEREPKSTTKVRGESPFVPTLCVPAFFALYTRNVGAITKKRQRKLRCAT